MRGPMKERSQRAPKPKGPKNYGQIAKRDVNNGFGLVDSSKQKRSVSQQRSGAHGAAQLPKGIMNIEEYKD